jgi:hypothetical protein
VQRGLNRPEGSPRRAGQVNRAGARGGGGSNSTPSRAGIHQVGDDTWGHLSSAVRGGGVKRAGGGGYLGRLGRTAGCWTGPR